MALEYIETLVVFDAEGNMTPKWFRWNGKKYEVDRVLDVRRAAAMIGGRTGIRYTCRILDKERHLYFDDFSNRWFVEYKDR